MPNLYALPKKTWDATKQAGSPASGGATWASGDIAVVFSATTVEFLPGVMQFTAPSHSGPPNYTDSPQQTAPISGVACLSAPTASLTVTQTLQIDLMRNTANKPVAGTAFEPSNDPQGTVWTASSTNRSSLGGALLSTLTVGPQILGTGELRISLSGMVSAGDRLYVRVRGPLLTSRPVLKVGFFVAKPAAAPAAYIRSGTSWNSLPLSAVSKAFPLPSGGASPDPLLWAAEATADLGGPQKWNGTGWVSAGSEAAYYDGTQWVKV